MSAAEIVTFEPLAAYFEPDSAYVFIAKPFEASAALTEGTATLTIVAAIQSDVTAEINFFICNNSFL